MLLDVRWDWRTLGVGVVVKIDKILIFFAFFLVEFDWSGEHADGG